MAKVCPHCGETSDRDNVCSWCNKSLVAEKKAETGGAPAAAKPGATARPGAPAAAGAPTQRVSERRKVPTVQQARPLWPYYVGALVTLVLVLVVVSFVVAKTAAGPPPEPGDWKTMESKTKLLTIGVPANYKFSTSGSAGTYEQISIKATKLCRVYVDGNGSKGAMSDIAAAAARVSGTEGGPEVATRGEGRFHATQGELYQKKDPNYKEEGEMGEWSFGGMPAAYSEYTTVKKVGLFAVKMKGWRLSCLGGDFGYQIFAEAPEAQWEKFKPIARQIIESAQKGAQQ